jgi:hypothetical protein
VNKRLDQIRSGAVPGSRAPADPKLAKARKFVAAFESLSDAEFDAVLARFVEQRKAA